MLAAIAFLLGDRWPTPASLDTSDFYEGRTGQDILIRLSLDHPRYESVEFDTSRERYVFQACGHDGRYIAGFNNEQREELSFAYVDAGRSFDRQFGASRWSLFGQAVRRLHRQLAGAGEGEALPRLRALLGEAHELLRTPFIALLKPSLRRLSPLN